MRTLNVRTQVAVAGSLLAVSSVLAQAPTSAQVWDVQFEADQMGP